MTRHGERLASGCLRLRSVLVLALVLLVPGQTRGLQGEGGQPASPEAGASVASRDTLTQTLDRLVRAEIEANRVVGMTVGVVRGADTLLLRGYGFADLEHRAPARVDTVYRIASVTKEFTAAAILRLVQAGRLELDATLDAFRTGFPVRGRTIEIAQLLNHTSGIPDYYDLPGWARILPPGSPYATVGRDAMLDLVKAEPFDFEPGTDWNYSNAGYDLLGDVIEEISGTDYWSQLQQDLLGPLDLQDTGRCPWDQVVAHRARGYLIEDRTPHNAYRIDTNILFASGSLCSTAEDLLAWNRLLHEGRVLRPELYERMITPEGASSSYGYGVRVGDVEGHRVLGHNGYSAGFASQLDYYPDDELSVVVLANTPARVAHLAEEIARATLGLPPIPVPRAPEGWLVRTPDGSDPGDSVFFRVMGAGMHSTAGPGAVYFDATRQAVPPYALSATFHQLADPDVDEGVGLVFGLQARDGVPSRYIRFRVRGDGTFRIDVTEDARTRVVKTWSRDPAVAEQPDGLGVTNSLGLTAAEGIVHFRVNDTEVAVIDGTELLPLDGRVGMWLGEGQNVHVEGFSLDHRNGDSEGER